MGKDRWTQVVAMAWLALLLAACAGYTASGVTSRNSETADGGTLTVGIGKANGSTEEEIETGAGADQVLEADVTLAVGKGSYTIELLGRDDQVTLVLTAQAGQTVTGHGQMVTDTFGTASYRVTAVEAENVDYQIVYIFQ